MPELNSGVRCVAIEGAPEAMEEVRAAAIHGYFRLAHGGLEVGGLLLGRRDGGTLHIEASRPILCQHAYGPSFTLSDVDLAGLAKMLEASTSEPELKGLVPVGWYHSHTRGDLEFSDRDLAVHNRWFAEAWQVALVLRPERARAVRAAFYVRDAQGLPQREPEFTLEPLAGVRRTILAAPVVPRVEPPQEALAPEPAVAAEDPPPAVELPLPSFAPSPVVAWESAPAVDVHLPSFAQSPVPEPRPGRRWWVLFALAWFVAVVSAAFALRDYWLPGPPAALQVALQDMNGQLAIQWNKEARAIQEAEGGILEIQDGDRKRVLKMSGPDMRGASVVVSRQSGRVAVRLEAKLPGRRTAVGQARFEGEPAPAEPASGRARLDAELGRFQTDLSSQQPRNRELEAAIAALRKRLAEGP